MSIEYVVNGNKLLKIDRKRHRVFYVVSNYNVNTENTRLNKNRTKIEGLKSRKSSIMRANNYNS